jgi:spore maturation protein CgeB
MIVNQLLQRLKEHGVEMRVYGYEVGEGLGEDFLELKQALRGRLFGDRFYEMIKRSKIMLNIPNDDHIRIGATRPQGLMEAAASRTFQIAYNAEDTRAIFDPSTEIVLFDSVDDLVDKIKYYLEHEEERDRIAQNAYEKFLRAYTGEKQIQMMIECLGL